jgi:uncharacterized protein
MAQTWAKLLFAHWPISQEVLRPFIPTGFEIDAFEGQSWIGVVPFAMRHVAPRYCPTVPYLSDFLELNVRTYVVKDGIAGVYFFSLDCSNPIAVYIARKAFHLPYFNAQMSLAELAGGAPGNGYEGKGDDCETNNYGCEIRYESKRRASGAQFRASYRPIGPVFEAAKGSLERFLTERYCLYTTDAKGNLYRGTIHHLVWPLQRAEAELEVNTMVQAELGLKLPDCEPHLLYSSSIDTIEWALARLS